MEVVVVRIYSAGERRDAELLLERLHSWGGVRGATVFEGKVGFGPGGESHAPFVLEFFELPDKAEEVLRYLQTFVAEGHVVSFRADMLMGDPPRR